MTCAFIVSISGIRTGTTSLSSQRLSTGFMGLLVSLGKEVKMKLAELLFLKMLVT